MRTLRISRFTQAAVAACLLLLVAGVLHLKDPRRGPDVLPISGYDLDLLKRGTLLSCETTGIDIGEKMWRQALLLDGFYQDEGTQRSFAWTRREASVRLVLAGGGDRTLEVVARAASVDLRVTAWWNGVDLGTRSVPRRWTPLTWELPAHLARVGASRLDLRSSAEVLAPSGRRQLALALDRIEVRPSSCGPQQLIATSLRSGEPVDLAAGSLLLFSPLLPPSPRLRVIAEGNPGATLEVFSYASGQHSSLGMVTVGSTGRVEETLAADPCCQADSGLVVLVQGPEPVRLSSLVLAGDVSPRAWRRAYGLVGKEALLIAALTALVIALAYARLRLPFARYAPWLDVALVSALALVLRLVFLQEYPDPGRSGDAFEYLLRARRLAAGHTQIFLDASWHGWQTWTRPPGYYLFLAAILGPLGGGVKTVIQLQAVLSALAAGATYLIAYPLFGRGAAVAAGLVSALYLESIGSFSRILSEPLYMLFLVPALAALSWTAARPSWRVAALAGTLFGLAALVRSAPIFYVPLAAVLLLIVHGFRPARRAAIALVGAMALVILPWCIRNSVIYGTVTGIDDLVVINLLQVSPDDRFVSIRDLDLETPEGARAYYSRLQAANHDRHLSRQAGAVLKATLEKKIADPVAALGGFAANLVSYFSLDEQSFRHTHREHRLDRVHFLTDLMNIQYLFVLVLGGCGFLITVRDRRTWPLVLWFFFNMVIINLLFHPETKYRFPTLPVAMVFAGTVLARGLGAVGRMADKEERSPDCDA